MICLFVLVLVASQCLGNTNMPAMTIRVLALYGSTPTNRPRADVLTDFARVDTPAVRQYLADYEVFAVRQAHDPFHPTGRFGSLLVRNGTIPSYCEDMTEAAAFLSSRIAAVNTREDAEVIIRLLPAMFSYHIVTVPPAFPDGAKPKIEREEDWTSSVTSTAAGWSLTCTLLFDRPIALCMRVTISVDRQGRLTVSEPRRVYSAGGYL